jgi:hypothetical protein
MGDWSFSMILDGLNVVMEVRINDMESADVPKYGAAGDVELRGDPDAPWLTRMFVQCGVLVVRLCHRPDPVPSLGCLSPQEACGHDGNVYAAECSSWKYVWFGVDCIGGHERLMCWRDSMICRCLRHTPLGTGWSDGAVAE